MNPDEGWIEVLGPQVKTLACGDFGQGGMCDWHEIVAVIEKRLCLTTLKVGRFLKHNFRKWYLGLR